MGDEPEQEPTAEDKAAAQQARETRIFNERVEDLANLIAQLTKMYDLSIVSAAVTRICMAVSDAVMRAENASPQIIMFMSGTFAGLSQNLRKKADELIAEQNKKDAEAAAGGDNESA